ncbi:MAG: hypothetical protein ACRC7O_02280, partial [Fimbriiglobus sp.]
MARKRTMNRRDLREQAEAAEAKDKVVVDGEVEEIEDEVDDDDDADADSDADTDDGDGGDDEDSPKPKAKAKKKAEPKVKKAPVKRTRAVKEVRMKAVWVVFDNSSKRVETFAFGQKAAAEELLARKAEEKKGTFYI